jgi:hypothetical protein
MIILDCKNLEEVCGGVEVEFFSVKAALIAMAVEIANAIR